MTTIIVLPVFGPPQSDESQGRLEFGWRAMSIDQISRVDIKPTRSTHLEAKGDAFDLAVTASSFGVIPLKILTIDYRQQTIKETTNEAH